MNSRHWVQVLLIPLCLAMAFTPPVLVVSVQPGWPQTVAGGVATSPALADLDGNGDLEVLVSSGDGYLCAWHQDGTPVAGWPQSIASSTYSSPAVGDLDGDGDLEVVVGSGGPWDAKVYAWHHDGSPVAGWPQSTEGEGAIGSCPALGDLDGDAKLEVVVGSYDRNVYAWHHDGTPVAGWPQTTGNYVLSSPALGDLDGDGDLEVVIGSADQRVYAWHHDGSPVAGWPQSTPGVVASSPALGDLDGDGHLEVVVGVGDWGAVEGYVYAWHGDGTQMAGWPQSMGAAWLSSPALGDLDGDGELEVMVGSMDHNVYAWHHDGTPVTGWPRTTEWYVVSSPALGDLDGDGELEIVVGSEDNNVYAWHHDGSPVTGWPQAARNGVLSSPALADLDGDGDVEVVAGSLDFDNNVYVWSCDTPTADLLPWPMFHHDLLHTGLYGYGVVEPGAHFIAHPVVGAAPLDVSFTDQSTDNPSSWSWDFGDGAASAEQNPTHQYTAVGRYAVSLSVVTNLGPDTETKEHCIAVLFPDVLTDHWAWSQVLSCVEANIVKGYDDGLYHPTWPVTRDQMAVYISRGLVEPSGDAAIPPGPPTATFTDVPTGHWAFKWVEYAVAQNIVGGYGDGTYRPAVQVDRGQMAVFVARAIVTPHGDEGLVGYTPPETATFSDVASDYWAYKYIEYIAQDSVAVSQGYPDGTYRPAVVVTRDQMAVYVQRAFQLPL